MVRLSASDGHTFDAYAVGEGERGLVVVQEIFGVNPHIRSVVDRFAAEGYHAVAPAFFDRVESGVELGYEGADREAAMGYARRLNWDNSLADLDAAVSYLHEQGATTVGVVGFCWGGTAAWLASSRLNVDAAVGYYGGGILGMIDEEPKAPTMLHFGALDAHIPLDGVAKVAEAHPEVTVHIYDEADHGFHCDARASYHPESAKVAWERTLAFFDQAFSA